MDYFGLVSLLEEMAGIKKEVKANGPGIHWLFHV